MGGDLHSSRIFLSWLASRTNASSASSPVASPADALAPHTPAPSSPRASRRSADVTASADQEMYPARDWASASLAAKFQPGASRLSASKPSRDDGMQTLPTGSHAGSSAAAEGFAYQHEQHRTLVPFEPEACTVSPSHDFSPAHGFSLDADTGHGTWRPPRPSESQMQVRPQVVTNLANVRHMRDLGKFDTHLCLSSDWQFVAHISSIIIVQRRSVTFRRPAKDVYSVAGTEQIRRGNR